LALLLTVFVIVIAFWALAEAAFAVLDKNPEETNRLSATRNIAVAITWLVFGGMAVVLSTTMWIAVAVTMGGAITALMIATVLKGKATTSPGITKIILPPARLLLFLLSPLERITTGMANFLLRKWGVDPKKLEAGVSEEDIRHMVNQGGEEGAIDAAEQEMINNVLEFDDKSAQDIVTHRRDIVAIDIASTREEIIDTIVRHAFSRYPVYEGSIDNIIGILNTKDILIHIFAADGKWEDFDLRNFIRSAHVVPPSKKIDELFEEMRKNQAHMVIVADEYGGCAGLLTVEDLIEEIVGDIYDEYDEVDTPDIEEIGENRYMLQGDAGLADVAAALEIDLPVEEYDTIGGFLVHLLERVPDDGEKPEIPHAGYIFKVREVNERRIESIFVEKKQTDKEND